VASDGYDSYTLIQYDGVDDPYHGGGDESSSESSSSLAGSVAESGDDASSQNEEQVWYLERGSQGTILDGVLLATFDSSVADEDGLSVEDGAASYADLVEDYSVGADYSRGVDTTDQFETNDDLSANLGGDGSVADGENIFTWSEADFASNALGAEGDSIDVADNGSDSLFFIEAGTEFLGQGGTVTDGSGKGDGGNNCPVRGNRAAR
jgi:hypothetical protein